MAVFNADRPVGWISFASIFIDLTTIKVIVLAGEVILSVDPHMINDIKYLLQQAYNVSSLSIRSKMFGPLSHISADDVWWILPAHVRYLTVPIKSAKEATIILRRHGHLSNVNFVFNGISTCIKFHKWLRRKKQDLTYRRKCFLFHVRRNKG